jgi:16S rRNA (cytosine967-C5)-methyltransferase
MPQGARPFEDPQFMEGDWTAQDPSETLVGLLPPDTLDGRILDVCAAPGTKSSHLAERFGRAVVTAMDSRRSRVYRMRETKERTKAPFAMVLGDVRSAPFRAGIAAGVLCDAPCSSLGVLRRRVDARWNMREADLARHGKTQYVLLESAARLVEPGGWLLYSVCSTEPEETDSVRAAFLSSNPRFHERAFHADVPDWARKGPGTLRILPGEGDCDGVYACLFGRSEEDR